MVVAATAREWLTCPRCGHELSSDKTISRDGDVTVTCPKCQAKDPLRDWRESQAVKSVGLPPRSLDHPILGVGGTDWTRFCIETVLGLSMASTGFVGIVCVVAAFYNMVESSGFESDNAIASIAHSLAFFRWSLVAYLCFKACRWLLAKMNAMPQPVPTNTHPLL